MMFRIKGYFRKGGKVVRFTKTVEADSEKLAREKLLSLIGSNHKVKRASIYIEGVEKVE